MKQFTEEKKKIGEVPVWVIYPLKQEKDKTVIFYHGWSSCAAMQKTRAMLLAAYGYTVWLPEAIHHGERGTLDYYATASYNLFWQVIFQNMEEYSFLYEDIKKQGYESPWVMGHSMGGLTALGVAVRFPNRLKGLVSLNGSGDWLLTHLFLQARFGVAFPKEWSLYEEVERWSPIGYVKSLRDVSMLLLNGEADTSVDPRAQKHFYEAMKTSGKDVSMMTYPGLAHFVTTNMMDKAIEWMEKRATKQAVQ